MDLNTVGIYKVAEMQRYAAMLPPFHPDQPYPELPPAGPVDAQNVVFGQFREFLRLLEWDGARFGTAAWNPFGWIIRPGETVILKPNLVVSMHPQGDLGVRCTDTDGPILRCIAEYALIALAGRGRLIIGDSPIKETDFDRVTRITGLADIVADLRSRSAVPVELVDFRDFVSERDEVAMVLGRDQAGDPRGYTLFDLAGHSELDPVSDQASRFRSTAAYYENKMSETHRKGRHLYSVANSVLQADVVLNVPKLKTHCKAGVTVALKNLVGICNEKRWLPHHRKGSPSAGGDEYSDDTSLGIKAIEKLKDFFVQNPIGKPLYPRVMWVNKAIRAVTGRDLIRSIRDNDADPYQNGGWHGNDTVWRMVLDLNKILFYGTSEGRLGERSPRKVFNFVDGLYAGQGEGPLRPDPKMAGVLMAGADSLLVDIAAATLMGFDHEQIRLLRHARAIQDYPVGSGDPTVMQLVSNVESWRSLDRLRSSHLGFRPPRGWRGFIEVGGSRVA